MSCSPGLWACHAGTPRIRQDGKQQGEVGAPLRDLVMDEGGGSVTAIPTL